MKAQKNYKKTIKNNDTDDISANNIKYAKQKTDRNVKKIKDYVKKDTIKDINTNDNLNNIITTLIDIDNYTKKFKVYPLELEEFAKEKKIKLLSIESMRGQALALMSQPEVRGKKHLGRDEAVKFFNNIGMGTKDAIQQFNKDTGFIRISMKGKYCLKYPFEHDLTHIDKRKDVSINGDKNDMVNIIKAWYRKNLVDVPNDEWQIGHLDPTIDDASENNVAYQPPIQAKYRDRYKYDKHFIKMWPTGSELVSNMNKYYTNKEQENIYEVLKQKFEVRADIHPSYYNSKEGDI